MVVSFRHMLAVLAISLGFCWTSAVQAQTPSNRIALVIGNGAYKGAPNATAANDAGLVAQTLTAAGFDVSGARDLDGDATRRAFRDFLERASQLGPDGLAFVYLSGYAVQFEGDNYFVPVDATLARDTDVPIQAIRLSDLTRALAGVPLKGRIIVLDGAYRNPFPASANLAGGLALVDAEPGALLATNAAPGTLGPSTTESYGVYGQALAEMLRQGGIPVQEVFDRVRLRVNELTKGADVPWSVSKLAGSFVFLQSSPDAPQPAVPQVTYEQMQRRPLREFPVNEAYAAAIARDSFQGYQDFLAAYPDSPYGGRVRVILAARREALSWRKTVNVGTDRAYWTYLRRYPKGPHAIDARRRLQSMSVALLPPPDFDPIEYDVPPPPEQEYRYVDSPVVVFDEPDYGPPPPPPPDYFLPPPPEENVYRLPPPPSAGPGFLPIPIPIPIPYGRSPAGPGRLDPVEGVRGTYAQPRPFMQNPQGGLAPQLLPGQQDIRLRPPSPTLVPPPPVQANRPPLPQAVPGALPVPQRVLPPNLGPTSNPQVQQLQQRQQQIQQLQQQQLQQRQQVDQQRQQQLLQQKGQADQLRQQQQQTLQQRQEQLLQQKQQGDQQRQQLLQQRQQVDQQRQQQLLQQKGQADQARQQQQNLQQRQQQLLQQKQQGDQQRQQQILQQRQQVDQQRQQQQIQQQRQQVDQQRQQQLLQQRQQVDQQRQQQIQQQRQQVDQQRQQQQNQQQRQQVDQQRQQQQQILQQRQQQQQQNQQQQIQQQRQQQIQQLQQRAPQVQQHLPPGVRLDCGRPGQPPCH